MSSWLFAAATASRLLLSVLFPDLPDLLTARVEISTPITSFKRLQEGVFLYKNGYSPFDGGVYHQAPALLPLLSFLPDHRSHPLLIILLYTAFDLLSANALLIIAKHGESTSSRYFKSPRKNLRWSPSAVAAVFLFNPFTIASCLGRTTAVFTNCIILQSIAAATVGNPLVSAALLGLASYFSLYPILLAPPTIILCFSNLYKAKHDHVGVVAFSCFYASILCGLFCLLLLGSWMLDGYSWRFLDSTYGIHLTLTDLTPNIGLWWYFFIEMFDSFRDFFLGVFWLHMSSYVGGMTIRLWRQPLFVIMSLLGIFAVFKPYPSIADVSLFAALIPLYRHLFPLLRYGFVASAAIMYATFLGPAFFYLWVYAGSGNANFFYAITLVWSLGLVIIIADLVYAALRDEVEIDRPELQGKDIRQM